MRLEVPPLGLVEPRLRPGLAPRALGVAVNDPGRAGEENPAAGRPEAPLPVVLLVVETVALVEGADGAERRPRRRQERAGESTRLRAAALPDGGLSSQRAPHLAPERERAPPRVQGQDSSDELGGTRLLDGRKEERRRVVPEERRTGDGQATGRDGPGEGRDRPRQEDEVGVREDDGIAAGSRDPRVQAAGVPEVLSGEEDPVGDARERPGLLVVTGVDDDDDFRRHSRPLRVRAKRVDRSRGESGGAVGDEYGGNHAC